MSTVEDVTPLPQDPLPLLRAVGARVRAGTATADDVAAAQQLAILSSPAMMLSVINPGFLQPAHVRIMDQHIVALHRGHFDRLMVVAPPRHTKTELNSKGGPLWRLRQDTGSQQALTTYGADLSSEFGGWGRDSIVSNPPLGLKVRQTSKARDRWNLAGAVGGLYAVGIGGTITGRGWHDGQVDDVVKDAQEANSQTTLDGHWDWWWSTWLTRRTRVNHRVTMGACWTRWNEQDLGGRLLRDERERWCLLHLRAIAETDETLSTVTDADASMLARWEGDDVSWHRDAGEALWPEVYGLDYLDEFRSNRYTFSALYQGEPTPTSGNLFRREDFRTWSREMASEGELWVLNHPLDGGAIRKEHIRPHDCWYFATADLAASTKTSADFTVIAVWAVTPAGDLLLVDRYRGRIGEDRHWQEAQKLHARWRFSWLSVEKGFIGTRLMYDAGRAGLKIREYDPRVADKITRAMPAVDRYAAGRIWHPDLALHPWVASELEPELLAFGGGGAHDDFCLVAATLVETPAGPQRLDEVTPGDTVLGSTGWTRVLAAGMTGVKPVVTNGALTGTADHPVFTDRGWVDLGDVDDTMHVWTLRPKSATSDGPAEATCEWKSLSSTASPSDAIPTPNRQLIVATSSRGDSGSNGASRPSTKRYGSSTTAPSPRVTSFTTPTVTYPTTPSTTSSSSPAQTTTPSTQPREGPEAARRRNWLTWLRSTTWRKGGTGAKKARRGIGSTGGSLKPGWWPSTASVFSAGGPTKQRSRRALGSVPTTANRNSGIVSAKTTRNESAPSAAPHTRSTGTRSSGVVASHAAPSSGGEAGAVYNLTTEDHTYFANGILVHNCDAVAQAAHHVPNPRSGARLRPVNSDSLDAHLARYTRGRRRQGVHDLGRM